MRHAASTNHPGVHMPCFPVAEPPRYEFPPFLQLFPCCSHLCLGGAVELLFRCSLRALRLCLPHMLGPRYLYQRVASCARYLLSCESDMIGQDDATLAVKARPHLLRPVGATAAVNHVASRAFTKSDCALPTPTLQCSTCTRG